MRLDAKQLRVSMPSEEERAKIKRRNVYLVLDNVLDTYNIGSFFRLADAVAAKAVILCGECEYPPSHRIHKAAVGTEEWVPWEYYKSTLEAIESLRQREEKLHVVAIEQDSRSISLKKFRESLDESRPTALVLGHETIGVSSEVLDEVDTIVEIPMLGINKSLNVHVSATIVLYSWENMS
jgi:tRNA G18 (ribose-2'-O)-methylase SpoU